MNNLLSQPLTFTLNREPVFYIRENEVLSANIPISITPSDSFCIPVYTGMEFGGHSVAILQAQGVDKLANTLQSELEELQDCDYSGWVTEMLKDEIIRCRCFAKSLRESVVKNRLCDNCNDWMRGGCLSSCSAYSEEQTHAKNTMKSDDKYHCSTCHKPYPLANIEVNVGDRVNFLVKQQSDTDPSLAYLIKEGVITELKGGCARIACDDGYSEIYFSDKLSHVGAPTILDIFANGQCECPSKDGDK
ncbi:hypothetical protein AB7Z50_08535 [Providencia rettgeri]